MPNSIFCVLLIGRSNASENDHHESAVGAQQKKEKKEPLEPNKRRKQKSRLESNKKKKGEGVWDEWEGGVLGFTSDRVPTLTKLAKSCSR